MSEHSQNQLSSQNQPMLLHVSMATTIQLEDGTINVAVSRLFYCRYKWTIFKHRQLILNFIKAHKKMVPTRGYTVATTARTRYAYRLHLNSLSGNRDASACLQVRGKGRETVRTHESWPHSRSSSQTSLSLAWYEIAHDVIILFPGDVVFVLLLDKRNRKKLSP